MVLLSHTSFLDHMLYRQFYQSCNNFYHPFSSKKSNAKDPCKREYMSRTTPITLSTCILTAAICRDCTRSRLLNCLFPLVNDGIFTFAQYNATLSSISNPLSAVTISPGRRSARKSQFEVKNLSLVCPPQLITSCGVIPIKNFTVLWCLYDENVCALARMFFGLLMKISKQSTITVFVPKCFRKQIGVVFHIYSLHGHLITGFGCKNNTP